MRSFIICTAFLILVIGMRTEELEGHRACGKDKFKFYIGKSSEEETNCDNYAASQDEV
jgi:hypothetical protein